MRTAAPLIVLVPALLACARALPAQSPQGPEVRRWPPHFEFQAGLGFGELEHKTENSNLDGEDSALLLRTGIEGYWSSNVGLGLSLDLMGSDDGLFSDQGFPDIQATSVDVFGFVGYAVAGDEGWVPIRFGPVFHQYSLEETDSNDTVDYDTFGLRFEVQPELALLRNDALAWTAFGRVAYTIGWTEVETDPETFEADADSDQIALELGTRLWFDQVRVGLSYLYRRESIDESDVVGGFQYFGVDATFQGLVLDFALHF